MSTWQQPLAIILVVSLTVVSCRKGTATGPSQPSPTSPAPPSSSEQGVFFAGELALIMTGAQSGVPVVLADRAGNVLAKVGNDGILFRSTTGESMLIRVGTDGRPTRAFVGGITYAFANYTQT